MTSDTTSPTKAQLLEALRSSGREALERLRALPAEEFERGRYESGWNGRQILAHMAAIEWTYPRLLDIAREGPPEAATPEAGGAKPAPGVRRTEPEEAKGTPTRTAQGGIDSYNERQVAKRADAPVAELLDEFERNRSATIAAVEGADDELLQHPVRSAGGITGRLADVINAVAVAHVTAHTNDIVEQR